MADQKVSQLTKLTTPASEDMLYIVDNPSGTPTSKMIPLKDFFGSVPANTVINGTLRVVANTTLQGSNTVVSANVNLTSSRGPQVSAAYLTIRSKSVVSSNNATTQLGGGLQGSIFWDDDYLYVATSNTVVKRVALSVFNS